MREPDVVPTQNAAPAPGHKSRVPAQRAPDPAATGDTAADTVSSWMPESRGEPAIHDAAQPMSPLGMLGVVTVCTLAGSWFLVSWLVLDSPVIDAVGETAGATLLALVLISIVGALRRTIGNND